MAYVEHAVSWELDRRAGKVYTLQAPQAAIPDDEVVASLETLAACPTGADNLSSSTKLRQDLEASRDYIFAKAGVPQDLFGPQ